MGSSSNFMCCTGTGQIRGSGSAIFVSTPQGKECPPVTQCCPDNQENTNTNTSNPTNNNTFSPTFNPTIQFNPVITVNCGCPSENEGQCECSGSVNASDISANICPTCTTEGSSITASPFGGNFVATSINPPTCITTPQETSLSTSGIGQFTQSGQTFLGTYSLVLTENQDGTKSVTLSFAGVSNTGSPVVFLTNEVVDNLSITPCANNFGASSNTLSSQTPDTNNQLTKKGVAVIIHPDGQVERKELPENKKHLKDI
jgi:hypothetical protein